MATVKSILMTLAFFAATPLLAAYAARDAVLPIAGRATGADGRLFLTALWITNPSERDAADVTLLFHPGNDKLPSHTSSLKLNPGETRVIDPIDANILGAAEALGALRVMASGEVLSMARLYSRGLATSFNAVPVQYAIGNGEAATLQGVAPAEGRYKLYVAEVADMPVDIVVSLLDPRGVTLASKRLYVDKSRQTIADVAELFPQFTNGRASLRIEGVNGGGRVVMAGSQIAHESQDSTPFEMSFSTTPRDRLGVWEALTYLAVAAAAGSALFLRR